MDTSCFIVLDKIGEFQLLHTLYGQAITAPIVVSEYGKPLPQWVQVANPEQNNI